MVESIERRRAERDRSCIGQPHILFERGIECSDDGLMADIEEDDFRASNSSSWTAACHKSSRPIEY